MARGTPVASKGTITAAGSGNIDALRDLIKTKIEAITSNSTQAWTKTTITADDCVYHSVGDRTLASGAGDTDLWLRLYRTGTTIYLNIAHDYSPTGGSPQTWALGMYRQTYSTGVILASSLSDTAAIDWWFVGNEYELCFIMLQSGTWRCFWVGAPIRPFTSRTNGVARVTSQSGTGSGVIIGVDRDITSNIQVGQKVLLFNQTPDGTAIQSVASDLVSVTAKASNQLTVDGVVGTFAVGSLVGLDPAACHLWVGSTTYWSCGNPDGTFAGIAGNFSSIYNSGQGTTESDGDPWTDDAYPVYELGLVGVNVINHIPRGKIQTMRLCPYGAQTDGDIMQIEWNTSDQWWVFVNSTTAIVTSWGTMIGPGAT